MLVTGPPASGKSYYASKLAQGYNCPHITLKGVVEHYVGQALALREKIAAGEGEVDPLMVEVLTAWDAALVHSPALPRLPEELVPRLVRRYLSRNVCKFRGYVLDGYPRSSEEVVSTFTVPPAEEPLEGEEHRPLKLEGGVTSQYLTPHLM